MREEIENIGNRPAVVLQFQHADNREAMNFRAYKRNPMELLARIDETLSRNRETRWPIIRGQIDEYFKEVNDNWWTATRHDIQSYAEFKELLKAKYWSESTQNIVRDNICYGRCGTGRGSTLTAYFLGKVCLARNLEPRIPEESLITKLAFHYEGGIARARLTVQVKTIQAMAALLEGYEHEGYYRRSRQGNDRYNDSVKETNNNNSHGSYRPNFNNLSLIHI